MKDKIRKRPNIIAGEHVIGRFRGDTAGPTVVVFGSLHGNEAAGALALERVASKLVELSLPRRGSVYFLAGNTRAILESVRFIDSDLNRHWTTRNVENNSPDSDRVGPLSEDKEQRELLTILNEILANAQDEVYALDLHSTSAEGSAFATVGDTLRNRSFAQMFPITILLGIEEQLEGTLLEYLNNLGAVTLGFEGGQHFAERTVDTHEALVWCALYNAGILLEGDGGGIEKWNAVLNERTGRSRIVEVRYRHAITPVDDFTMRPGFDNFDPVRQGQVLATDAGGDVVAPETGVILMPLYQKLGEDGFFVGREVAPFWLRLSGVLRHLKIYDLMPLLPGVRRSGDPDTLEINTRIARLFPLQIFHLLGYRRLRWSDDRLVVSRRKFDTTGPFGRG
ncbi:MAG TPA: succinylglutamate desuccinylase/aspartoacylase family protein [Pyrinomonadaceae bacterium]